MAVFVVDEVRVAWFNVRLCFLINVNLGGDRGGRGKIF